MPIQLLPATPAFELVGLRAENLRGYDNAYLRLVKKRTVLVGPNNAGKTSILRLADWLLNEAEVAVFEGRAPVPQAYIDLLTPARHTGARARRLTLEIALADRRRHKRFECVDGVASLRVDLRFTPTPALTLHVGQPRRDGSRESDPKAIALLNEVRNEISFVLIPSFRDAASSRFRDSLQAAFRARLSQRALHRKQAGAPVEYRKVLKARETLKGVAEELARPLWQAMNSTVPPGLASDANIELNVEVTDLVEWMASRLSLRITTGAHDVETVHPIDVGSGLQSLLDVAIQLSEGGPDEESLVIAVEEPEAFLHPAAQRAVARHLLANGPAKRIVSTHSPTVVAEARFDQVVVVHDQQFHAPKTSTERREAINTFMLGGRASELLFYRSLLFVEGDGDRLFLEELRRRVAKHDPRGRVDSLGVVATGSCTQFAPWIELVRAYGKTGANPFSWRVASDGDSTAEVAVAFANAGIPVSAAARAAFDNVRQVAGKGVAADWAQACLDANKVCEHENVAAFFSPIDLEYMALGSASAQTLQSIAKQAGLGSAALNDVLRSLGCKFEGKAMNDPLKAPWVRAFIGKTLPWAEVTEACKRLIHLWLCGVMSEDDAAKLLGAVAKNNG